MKWPIALAGLLLACVAVGSAQKLDVKIIDRQDKEDGYDYVAVYNNVAVDEANRSFLFACFSSDPIPHAWSQTLTVSGPGLSR